MMSTEYPFARKTKNPRLSLKTLCMLAFSLVAAVAYPQGKGAVLSGEAANRMSRLLQEIREKILDELTAMPPESDHLAVAEPT
jgi:hypothetical protein